MTDLDALKLFVEQTIKLENSRFKEELKERKKTCVSFHWTREEGQLDVEHQFPDADTTSGFLLPARFLIQDREPCSLRNLAKTIPKLDISDDLKSKFTEARDAFNEFLDQELSNIKPPEGPPTRKKVLQVFLYGHYSHADPKWRLIYQQWMRIPMLGSLLEMEFVHIINSLSRICTYLRINVIEPAILELEENKAT